MTEAQALVAYTRICHGVYWLKHKNRDEYASLMRRVREDGGDPQAWSAEVQEAHANGLRVTEEWEPSTCQG